MFALVNIVGPKLSEETINLNSFSKKLESIFAD